MTMEAFLSPDHSSFENLPDFDAALLDRIRARLSERTLVLIGMMGAGKSSIGKRLAHVLNLPFVDADTEIEKAAGMPITDIFAEHGEEYFRAGEARVINRLLEDGPSIVATGGGAWMNPETRTAITEHGISLWLNSPADVLMRRVRKRATRPLLQTPDPEGTLRRLLREREPFYALADVEVKSVDSPHHVVLEDVLHALDRHFYSAAPAVP